MIVDVLDDDDALERVAVAHVDPAKAEVIRELAGRFPPSAQDDFGPAAAIKTGKAQLVDSISGEMLVRVAQDDEHLEAIRSLGLRSFKIVPLATRRRPVGASRQAALRDQLLGFRDRNAGHAVRLVHPAVSVEALLLGPALTAEHGVLIRQKLRLWRVAERRVLDRIRRHLHRWSRER